VSKRVRELGFQETLRMTPSRFMRQERLGRRHQDRRPRRAPRGRSALGLDHPAGIAGEVPGENGVRQSQRYPPLPRAMHPPADGHRCHPGRVPRAGLPLNRGDEDRPVRRRDPPRPPHLRAIFHRGRLRCSRGEPSCGCAGARRTGPKASGRSAGIQALVQQMPSLGLPSERW
jgi:hypothetical protein